MSKGLIAFIVVACLALAFMLYKSMKESADKAHQQSDEIMKEFKTIDKDLQRSKNRIDSLNKELLNSIKDTAHATGR